MDIWNYSLNFQGFINHFVPDLATEKCSEGRKCSTIAVPDQVWSVYYRPVDQLNSFLLAIKLLHQSGAITQLFLSWHTQTNGHVYYTSCYNPGAAISKYHAYFTRDCCIYSLKWDWLKQHITLRALKNEDHLLAKLAVASIQSYSQDEEKLNSVPSQI